MLLLLLLLLLTLVFVLLLLLLLLLLLFLPRAGIVANGVVAAAVPPASIVGISYQRPNKISVCRLNRRPTYRCQKRLWTIWWKSWMRMGTAR